MQSKHDHPTNFDAASTSEPRYASGFLRRTIGGIFGVILLSLVVYGVGYGWEWIRGEVRDSRQRSVLHDFNLYLWTEPGFILPVNESDKAANDANRDCLATTNPNVVRRAMQEFAKQSGYKNELSGSPNFPIESLIPTRRGFFMVGPYLYVCTDLEGNPIRLGPSLGSPNT